MSRPMTLWLALLAGAVIFGWSTLAAAFHPVSAFNRPAWQGGGNRGYFTGSPRFKGFDCGTCHVNAPGQIRFQLSATPEDIFTTGRYTPGQLYDIEIGVTGADDKPLRTWVMEALDQSDAPLNVFEDVPLGCIGNNGQARSCLQPACNSICRFNQDVSATCAPLGQSICSELVQLPGCEQCSATPGQCSGCTTIDGVVAGSVAMPPWRIRFLAPPAGSGPITLYFGGVAGTSDHSSLDDDYEMASFRLCEGDEPCALDPTSAAEPAGDYTPQQTSGCQLSAAGAASPAQGGWWGLLCALAGWGLLARSRRRTEPSTARPKSRRGFRAHR